MNETFQEYVNCRGLAVQSDRENGVIRGVKILGTESRDGRVYSAKALRKAASVYEGAKVKLKQPKADPPQSCDYRGCIGVLRNVTTRDGEGLFGDLHLNPGYRLAEQLLWDAENCPQNLALTHNVQAVTSRRQGSVLVEAISCVHGIDLVAGPAHTSALFETADSEPEGAPAPEVGHEQTSLASLTADRLRKSRPDLLEELLAEPQRRIAQLIEKRDELRSKEHLARRRDSVRTLLAEYGLSVDAPTDRWQRAVVTERFLESLIGAEDDEAVRRMIRERLEAAREVAESVSSWNRDWGVGGGSSRGSENHATCREQSPVPADPPGTAAAFADRILLKPARCVLPYRHPLATRLPDADQ